MLQYLFWTTGQGNSTTQQQREVVLSSHPWLLILLGLVSPQDLGLPDQLGELLDLCLGRHVCVLITNAHDHAPKDRGIRLWGRETIQ